MVTNIEIRVSREFSEIANKFLEAARNNMMQAGWSEDWISREMERQKNAIRDDVKKFGEISKIALMREGI